MWRVPGLWSNKAAFFAFIGMMNSKTGVLLVNLGTPDAPDKPAVWRYLRQFLLDPRVIDIPWLGRNLLVRGVILPFRSGNSTKLYQKLWMPTGSPLKVYGERLTEGVQRELGSEFIVELAMRYQQPSIAKAIDKLLQQQLSFDAEIGHLIRS